MDLGQPCLTEPEEGGSRVEGEVGGREGEDAVGGLVNHSREGVLCPSDRCHRSFSVPAARAGSALLCEEAHGHGAVGRSDALTGLGQRHRPLGPVGEGGEQRLRAPHPARELGLADLFGQAQRDGTGDPARARVLDIGEVDPDAPSSGRWLDHLALWAADREGDESLAGCVVKFAAPELSGDQLVGVAELAEIAGVAASTLRAYIARGEGDVPQPQATISGRNVWARPVAEEWAERRRRSADGVTAAVSRSGSGPSPAPGVTDVWDRFSRSFFNRMWENPEWRKRWALRWRNEASVRKLAEDLSWDVAASIDRLVPAADLGTTISYAVLHEFSRAQRGDPALSYGNYAITRPVTRMLDWLIRHDPPAAHHAINGIVGEAERQLNIARHQSQESLRRSLSLDGTLDKDALDAFLDRVLIP